MTSINDIYKLDDPHSSDDEPPAAALKQNHNDGRHTNGKQDDLFVIQTTTAPVVTAADDVIDLVDEQYSESDESDDIVSIGSDGGSTNLTNVTGGLTDNSLTTPATFRAINPVKRIDSPIVGVGEFVDDSATSNRRKSNNIRYFAPTDITLRCYNCNGVGHYSEQCPYDRVYKPCYICGIRNHQSWKCPNDLCFKCNLPGHKSDVCTNARVSNTFCLLCGSVSHIYQQCAGHDTHHRQDIKASRCMVCGKQGHINCSTDNTKSKQLRHVKPAPYCANCAASGHTHLQCTARQMDAIININASTGIPQSSMRNNEYDDDSHTSSDRLCFVCNKPGHLKRDCPELQNRQRRYTAPGRYNNEQYDRRDSRSSYNNDSRYRSVSTVREQTFVESYTRPAIYIGKRGRSRERDTDKERSRSSSVSSQKSSYSSKHSRKY